MPGGKAREMRGKIAKTASAGREERKKGGEREEKERERLMRERF